MSNVIQHRRGTAATWSTANPILANGEFGYETDTDIIKIGDGVTHYNSLTKVYKPAKKGYMHFAYAIGGSPDVASGQTNFINPFTIIVPTGETWKLTKVSHKINSGTSLTFKKIQIDGSDASGFTGLSSTQSWTDSDPTDVDISAGIHRIAPVITAINANPTNWSCSIVIERPI